MSSAIYAYLDSLITRRSISFLRRADTDPRFTLRAIRHDRDLKGIPGLPAVPDVWLDCLIDKSKRYPIALEIDVTTAPPDSDEPASGPVWYRPGESTPVSLFAH